MSEGIRGGFALTYKVLSSFEETGRARRGYFVEGLGAAQFATGATVDRLRSFARDPNVEREPVVVTLAATDPANPYGAALPWPGLAPHRTAVTSLRDAPEPAAGAQLDQRSRHRPGRKAGALVVMVDGFLVLYVERGGKTVLTFSDDERMLEVAARSLASTVRSGLGKLRVERVDGEFAIGTTLGSALEDAGFAPTPQGLRLRN